MSLVIHVPHACTNVPDEYRNQFVLADAELKSEVIASADLHTDALARAAWPSAKIVETDVSRIVCDVERYADDALEEMAAVGRGMIYTKTHRGQPLRRSTTKAEREGIKKRYYDPHWCRLRSAAKGNILIDLHSYPADPWPVESGQSAQRPEIDIGATDGVTPEHWRDALMTHFNNCGYETGLNMPYAGVIDAGARAAVMIEIRRDILVAPESGPGWERLVRALASTSLPKEH